MNVAYFLLSCTIDPPLPTRKQNLAINPKSDPSSPHNWKVARVKKHVLGTYACRVRTRTTVHVHVHYQSVEVMQSFIHVQQKPFIPDDASPCSYMHIMHYQKRYICSERRSAFKQQLIDCSLFAAALSYSYKPVSSFNEQLEPRRSSYEAPRGLCEHRYSTTALMWSGKTK